VHPFSERTAPQQRSNSQNRCDARHCEGQESRMVLAFPPRRPKIPRRRLLPQRGFQAETAAPSRLRTAKLVKFRPSPSGSGRRSMRLLRARRFSSRLFPTGFLAYRFRLRQWPQTGLRRTGIHRKTGSDPMHLDWIWLNPGGLRSGLRRHCPGHIRRRLDIRLGRGWLRRTYAKLSHADRPSCCSNGLNGYPVRLAQPNPRCPARLSKWP
jgi:hypothetical protein